MIPGVPTISRFFGITIAMLFDDHGFPHFHARHAEGEAKVRIDNLEVIDSNLGDDSSASSSPGRAPSGGARRGLAPSAIR
jgi:hypothetical protein